VSRLARQLASVLALASAAAALGCGEDATAPAASKDPTSPALATTRAATAVYTVEDLGPPGGSTSEALAINPADAVVGWRTVVSGVFESHGFLWQDGVMTDLATLGACRHRHEHHRAGEIAGWSTLVSGDTRAVR